MRVGRMALRMVIPEEKDVKVCVVGPKASGKTSITRALADWDPKSACYAPTAGVRQAHLSLLNAPPRNDCICKLALFCSIRFLIKAPVSYMGSTPGSSHMMINACHIQSQSHQLLKGICSYISPFSDHLVQLVGCALISSYVGFCKHALQSQIPGVLVKSFVKYYCN